MVLPRLLAATSLHFFVWGVFLAYLYYYIPRVRSTVNNFGVALSPGEEFIFQIGDWASYYMNAIMLVVCALVIGIDLLVITMIRSRGGRIVAFTVLAACPVNLLLICHWTLAGLLNRIAHHMQWMDV